MNRVVGHGRRTTVGLLVLCVAVVVGLLLAQGGATDGTGGAAASSPGQASRIPAPEGTGLPAPAVEDPAASQTPESGLETVAESDLPGEAHDTLELIRSGGPFPFRQDDATFFNREGILPQRPRDYYREYTVRTRGSPDRGARRIVAGEGGDLFYTADHYDSFVQIEEGR